MSRLRPRIDCLAAMGAAVVVLISSPCAADAQGFMSRMASAAKEAAATTRDVAAEASLSRANPVDLSGWKLPMVPLGAGVSLSVSQVDILDSVGVRVHGSLQNALDVPVTVPIPADSAFSLIDSRGRRLRLIARVRVNGHTGVKQVAVAPAKRVPLVLIFGSADPSELRATLRVGSGAVLGEIPVRMAGVDGGPARGGSGTTFAGSAGGSASGRVTIGDVELTPPAGWVRADQKGIPIFLDPTSVKQSVAFIAVAPSVKLRTPLRDWVRSNWQGKKGEEALGEWSQIRNDDGEEASVWTSERRDDGIEVFRRYRGIQVLDRATLLVGTSTSLDRDKKMLDRMYEVASTVTVAGGGPGAATPKPLPPMPKPAPAPAPSPEPKRAPPPPARGGSPNFVGTYFSWGIINTKLLVLANGTWETAQSTGHWTSKGRMIMLDGNARGWCGGRGILNDDETQLSFDCVSSDGFPMNVSFAKHSKEIER